MRLWTLHPRYLDSRGLVALWREALLAQAVLLGKTQGYARHPQLARFLAQASPVACVAEYLRAVEAEGARRGFRFAAEKIDRRKWTSQMVVTRGQLQYEWRHLKQKLARRNPPWLHAVCHIAWPRSHPLFRVVPGPIENWEKV